MTSTPSLLAMMSQASQHTSSLSISTQTSPAPTQSSRAILGADGPLAGHLNAYQVRPGQLDMADMVEQSLAYGGIAMIEAGTGVGKTFAYLVPAILARKRIVISTATKVLQDQLIQKDIPFLEKVLGQHLLEPMSATVMKGLSNYLCLRRFHEMEAQQILIEDGNIKKLTQWKETTLLGEKNELHIPESLWQKVQSSSETRIGSSCHYAQACFVSKMRARAHNSKIIVVNHHLLFADIAMKRAGIPTTLLPPYEAIILDEAHRVEDTATLFFGTELSKRALEEWVYDCEQQCKMHDVTRIILARFSQVLMHADAGESKQSFNVTGEVERILFGLDDALDAAHGVLHKSSLGLNSEEVSEKKKLDVFNQLKKRLGGFRHAIAELLSHNPEQQTWIQVGKKDCVLGASPIHVGALLQKDFFPITRSVVLTSATLSSSGNFEFVRSRLGISEDIDEAVVPSPFDYKTQVCLWVPEHLPDPRTPEHLSRAKDHILELIRITGGGAMVLTTSLKSAEVFSAHLKKHYDGPVFTSADGAGAQLLDLFRADPKSVLVASMGFWEGIDVQGEALRLLILDKLPFEAPSDPLIRARCERIEADEKSAFKEYVLPSCAITLKQGFGRLIRSHQDRGIVAILDPRLKQKSYGKVLLRALPETHVAKTMADVSEFWKQLT